MSHLSPTALKANRREVFRMLHLSRPRAATLVEQLVVAATGFLSMLVFARSLPPSEWAILSFAAGVMIVMQGVQLSVVILPMISLGAGSLSSTVDQHNWTWMNRLVAFASTALLAVIGTATLFSDAGWMGTSLFYAGLMVVPAFTYEYLRRRLILTQRYRDLVVAGLMYASGVTLSLSGQLVFDLSPWFMPFTYWPGVLMAVYLSGGFDPVRWSPPSLSWLKPIKSFAPWAVGGAAAMAGYNFAILGMLGWISGAAAVAAFGATRLLIQPVNTLIGAFNSLDLPKAASAYSRGAQELVRVQVRSALRLAVVGGIYISVIGLFAEPVADFLFDGLYSDQRLVRSWAVVGFLMLLTTPTENMFYVTRQPQYLLLSRSLASIVGCGLAYFLIPQFEAIGAVLGIALGWIIALLSGMMILMFVNRPRS